MEPHEYEDDWKNIELNRLKRRNRRVAWVLLVCMFMWAFFINGQMMFWQFTGNLGIIPKDEVAYLVENMEYYYLYNEVFESEDYLTLKGDLLDRDWVTSSIFEDFVYGVSELAGDQYSYFYFDSFLDFRADYTYLTENLDDGFQYRLTDDGVGYIQFVEFIEDTSVRFKEALKTMEDEKVTQLIIDLRGNPGGLLYECNDIADMLLPETEIISQYFNDGSTYIYYSDEEQATFESISVWLDEESASCSEMLALTLKTNLGDQVKIIGKNTVGKDVTQSVVENDTFNYALFIVTSSWGVKKQTVKDLNRMLDKYDNEELNSFEDYYKFVLE